MIANRERSSNANRIRITAYNFLSRFVDIDMEPLFGIGKKPIS